jgi:benzoyl-CoA reductase/2-hydroxyglutaryl-CoA dehydratase subunit BcrC/BadD/HgdB
VSTPTSLQTEASASFYRTELSRIRAALAEGSSQLTDERLDAACAAYEEQRRHMQDLFALRRGHPGALTGRDALVVTLASHFMPVENHLDAVKVLLAELKKVTASADPRPRVYMAGSVCQSPSYFEAVEDAGLLVVDDELCTGTRFFEAAPDAAHREDPLERLTHLYLNRTPCPAKHALGINAAAQLLERVQRADAAGVVFLFTKLCDPWSFDYPHLRDALDNAGIPSLLLEIEQHQPPSEQLRTRLSAFAELVAASSGNSPGPNP